MFSQMQKDVSRLFTKSHQITQRVEQVADGIIPLKLNKSFLNTVYKEKNYDISLTVPISDTENVTVELEKFNVLTKDFILRTSSGDTIRDFNPGLFYKGSIKGREGFASFNIFQDQIIGLIVIKGFGNFNVVRLDNSDVDYVVYNDLNFKEERSFECHTPDEDVIEIDRRNRSKVTVDHRYDTCVKFYIEGDYALYQDKGSIEAAEEYITGLFAEVAVLYDNESIGIEISEIMVWDEPDGYDQNDSGTALDQFKANNPDFNGDLASLYALGGNGTGGLAWVDVLCVDDWNYAYMNIGSSYNEVPTYSWSVEVVAHEVGHNFGSRHTHACVWNGNNTQIDDCGNEYYYNNGNTPEGDACYDHNNPILPDAGTIMSYCHLITGIGIDLALGFGEQPGNVIRSGYDGAACLTECTGGAASPIADFEADPTEVCEGDPVYFTDLSENNPNNWDWTFDGGDPEYSDEEEPEVYYYYAGAYDVTLEVSNSAGSDEMTKEEYIIVYPVAIPDFTYTIVNDNEVHFTNNSQEATNYYWDFDDGDDSNEENPVHIFTEDGGYYVTLYASNDDCTDYEQVSHWVEIVTPPSAGLTMDHWEGCMPDTIHFHDASSSNVDSRLWIFEAGNPNSSTLKNPVVTYDTTGFFDVTLQVFNALYSDTVYYHDTIHIHTIPVANFLYTINGNTVQFNNTTFDGDTYFWNFGDDSTSVDTNTVHTYIEGGDYNVMLVATNECGKDTVIKQIQITTQAVANFTVDTTVGCATFVANFHSLSNTDSVLWVFEGGTPDSSYVINPVVNYSIAGKYDVIMYAANDLGNDTLIMQDYIEVLAQPTGSFVYDVSGYTADFTQSTANIDTFRWEFGDGTYSTEINPSHTYAEDGDYTVKFIYSNLCDTLNDTKTVTIANPPVANFTFSATEGCKPLTVQFTNMSSSNTDSYLWTFDGGNPATSTEENPVVTYENKGTYNVVLEVTNEVGGNTKTEVNLIHVIGPPVPAFTVTSEELSYDFTYTGETATIVKWNFGDGASAIGQNVNHVYLQEGQYTLQLIAENNCGKDTLEQVIDIALRPTAAFEFNKAEGCAPLQVEYTNMSSSSANSFLWHFEGGNPEYSVDKNPAVVYVMSGDFDVSLIAYGENGNDTLVQEDLISVDAGPVVDYSYDIDGAKVSFTELASDDASSFYWDFGDGNISEEVNPIHTYAATGNYKVTLYANNDCGQQSISKNIYVVVSAVSELPFTEVKLYPNPNNGEFMIDLKVEEQGEYDIKVFNTVGKLFDVKKKYLKSGENKLRYNFDRLNKGLYIIKISMDSRSYKLLFDVQ
jgi:PKD repeat protein